MIKCAHCKNRHETVAEVRICSKVQIAQKVAPITVDIEQIEREMHAMVARAERLEDEQVAQFKMRRDEALGIFNGSGSVAVAAPVVAIPQPRRSAEKITVAVFEPGMYRTDGVVYLVQCSKKNTDRLYAKRLVPTYHGTELHKLHLEYDKGAIWNIKAADRMTVEEVESLGKLTGHCWVCGRELKVQKSINAGIGPVCAKKV